MLKKILFAIALGVVSGSEYCNINQCGCDDDDGYDAVWCNDDNAVMKSTWCHASSDNCATCSGTWCEPAEDPSWGYECGEGPDDWGSLGPGWYPDCNGMEQSPINIPLSATSSSSKTGAVAAPFVSTKTLGISSATLTVTQSHGAPKFSCASAGSCGTLTHDSVDYDLLQFHMHSPSEHTIDGMYYPLCMHMVHGSDAGGYSVLGVLFSGTEPEDSTTCTACDEFDKLYSDATIGDAAGEPRTGINLDAFADGSMGHYQYDGSFTTPPCTEGVNWYLQAKTISIKQSQIDTYWAHIGGFPGNARDPQPLNARTITFNVDA